MRHWPCIPVHLMATSDPASCMQYPVGVAVVVGFGLLACFLSWLHEKRQGGKDTVEFFLTARNSVNTVTIGW